MALLRLVGWAGFLLGARILTNLQVLGLNKPELSAFNQIHRQAAA